MKYVEVTSDKEFRSFWDSKKKIGRNPTKVPYDSLCKKMLSDGSIKLVTKKTKVVSPKKDGK